MSGGALLLALLLPPLSGLGCEASAKNGREAAQQKLLEGQASLRSAEGIATLREAARLFERAGRRADHAEALYWLALAQQKAGDHAAALATIRQAMSVQPKGAEGDKSGFYSEFEAEQMQGELHTELADHGAAESAFERARQLAVASKSRWNEWRSVEGLAELQARQRHTERARALWAEARGIVAPESRWGFGQAAKRSGDFERAVGEVDAARKLYREALGAYREALAKLSAEPGTPNPGMHVERSQLGAAEALLALARLEQSSQSYAAAHDACREGLALMASMPTKAEKDADGLTWSEGARQNREVSEQLERVKAEAQRELGKQPLSPELRAAIRVSGNKVFLARPLFERFRRDPELLMRRARFVPELKDGQVIGVRVFGIREEALWGALGFRNGDRIVRINEHEAASLSSSPSARAALDAAPSIRVELERQGVAQRLEFAPE